MYTYDGNDQSEMICSACNEPMKKGSITLTYLGSTFPVGLFKCEQCNMVFIQEDLATGKMEQVEKTLEDK